MSMPASDALAAWKARSQKVLIEFLEAELDLAFTFLQTAEIEAGINTGHSKMALENSRTALTSIRQFQGRITDADRWEKVHRRASELEAALNAFGRR
jgi:hypothetical protein